jgi:hypothetical protein
MRESNERTAADQEKAYDTDKNYKNHLLALQIITMEAINIVASSTKTVVRTPPQNGLIYIFVILPLIVVIAPGFEQRPGE